MVCVLVAPVRGAELSAVDNLDAHRWNCVRPTARSAEALVQRNPTVPGCQVPDVPGEIGLRWKSGRQIQLAFESEASRD